MRKYLCIDLKGFYASCECVERSLDPFKVNLVVSDPTRGQGAITLAITPKLKSLGVKNRSRLYEIPSNIKYIIAKPRMRLYMNYSVRIYEIYLKYLAKEDIHVYSVDEAFLDITNYIKLYNKDEFGIAKMIMKDIYETTKITSTCGIGTNMFLSKVALDIISKKDKSNIGYLNEELFKDKLWNHTPLRDFWQIGAGIEKVLHQNKMYTMKDISGANENLLKKLFGINYKLLKDHSVGKESCEIKDIKMYKSKSKSMNSSQILFKDYNFNDGKIIVKEMLDALLLRLISKNKMTNGIALGLGYSGYEIDSVRLSKKLEHPTNRYSILIEEIMDMYNKIFDKNHEIRKISITFFGLKDKLYDQLNLFIDHNKNLKEDNLSIVVENIKKRYGKNSILRATSYEKRANQLRRNNLIGGHNAEY